MKFTGLDQSYVLKQDNLRLSAQNTVLKDAIELVKEYIENDEDYRDQILRIINDVKDFVQLTDNDNYLKNV